MSTTASMPLSKTIVLELASVLAGPSAGQYLAELGATVIKVENARTGGDVTRTWRIAGEDTKDDRSAYFSCCNWGKLSIALDLSVAGGRKIVEELAQRADVVLASYKPGAAARLGVDAARLCSINPRLVYVSVTGYGESDSRAGYDAAIQAESGFMMMNGQADGPPTKMPVALMDLLAGHQIKEEVLVGLLQRELTGVGYQSSVSLFDSAIVSLANQASGWLQAGAEPGRMGSAHPSIAPYGTPFLTADDQWVSLAVGTDEQFGKLVGILGLESELMDPRFLTNGSRVENRTELESTIAAAIRLKTLEELLPSLQSASIPCSKVATVSAALSTEAGRRLVLSSDSQSAALSATRQSAREFRLPVSAPPHFGQHTVQVLTEILGYDRSRVENAFHTGATAQAD